MSKNAVMLVVNDGNDVRAHKEAIALVEAGYRVTMIGRSPAHVQTEQQLLDGVEILITPQIKDAKELRAFAADAVELSLRDRLHAVALAALWDAADLKFAAAPPAPKILKAESAVFTGPVPIAQTKRNKWAARLHRFGLRADGNRALMGRNQPDRMIRTLKWVGWSVLFRALWVVSKAALFRIDFSKLAAAPVRLYRIFRRLLPAPLRARLQAKVVGMANRRRAKANFFLYYLESRDAVRAAKPDIVHAHDLYMLRAAVKTAKENSAKAIYDAHEFERHRSHRLTDEQRSVIIDEEERFIKDVDGVITVSDSIAAEMSRLLNLRHVELIYNSPVTEGFYQPPFRNVRVAAGVGPATPLALFVGKVYDIHRHDHRVDHLIQALAQTPDMHLALLSITTPASRDQITNWAQKYHVADRVHILDPVPYKELLSYIHAADIGVYSMPARCLNIEYSMPNKLFEYALAGVPLAVSNLTDATRFVTELGCGEPFDSWSVRATADALMRVYENCDRYTMDGERLRAAQAAYGWEAQGAKLRRLYAAVLAGERPAHNGLDEKRYPVVPPGGGEREDLAIQAAE